MNKPEAGAAVVHLKPGREHSLEGRHPWIFSGAFQSIPRVYFISQLISSASRVRMWCGSRNPCGSRGKRMKRVAIPRSLSPW